MIGQVVKGEDERGGVPASGQRQPPRYERQEDDGDDQPGDQVRDRTPHGGGVPAEPSVVQGGWGDAGHRLSVPCCLPRVIRAGRRSGPGRPADVPLVQTCDRGRGASGRTGRCDGTSFESPRRRRGALLGVMRLSPRQSRPPSTVAHPLTRPGTRHCWPGRVQPRLVRKKDLDFRTSRDVTPPGLPTTSTLRGASRCSAAGPSAAQLLRAMAR
jgi:hypothetical protein